MATPWIPSSRCYRKQLRKGVFLPWKIWDRFQFVILRSKNFYTNARDAQILMENLPCGIIISWSLRYLSKKIEDCCDTIRRKSIGILSYEVEVDINDCFLESNQECCAEFEDYTFEMFTTYSKDYLIALTKTLRGKWNYAFGTTIAKNETVYLSILRQRKELIKLHRLIFSGLREQEIYPQLILSIYPMVVINSLSFIENEDRAPVHSNENNRAICPFCAKLSDKTILTGIDPSHLTIIY